MLGCLKYKQVTLTRIKANSELINVILVIQTFERKTKKYKIKWANIFIYFEINLKKKLKKTKHFICLTVRCKSNLDQCWTLINALQTNWILHINIYQISEIYSKKIIFNWFYYIENNWLIVVMLLFSSKHVLTHKRK